MARLTCMRGGPNRRALDFFVLRVSCLLHRGDCLCVGSDQNVFLLFIVLRDSGVVATLH